MKKTITILLVLIGFGLSAQITIDKKIKKTLVSSEWIPIDTINSVKGVNVVSDSVMYTFNKVPDRYYKRVETDIHLIGYLGTWPSIGDSLIEMTNKLRLEVFRSRRALLSQLEKTYVYVEIENSNDDIIEKTLIKANELGVTNNDTYWNHSLVKPVWYIEPPQDTIPE